MTFHTANCGLVLIIFKPRRSRRDAPDWELTMSILEAVRIRALHLPTIIVPRWPRLKVGRTIAEAAKAYADAVAVPYLIAFGLEPQKTATRERKRQHFND